MYVTWYINSAATGWRWGGGIETLSFQMQYTFQICHRSSVNEMNLKKKMLQWRGREKGKEGGEEEVPKESIKLLISVNFLKIQTSAKRTNGAQIHFR